DAQTVVVYDGGRRFGAGDIGVDWVGDVQEESLVRAENGVALDLHRDEAAGLARRDGDGAVGRHVVGTGDCRAVLRRIRDRDRLVARVRQEYGEVGVDRPGIALKEGDVTDRDRRSAVVIDDQAGPLGADYAGVDRVAQVEEESAVAL